MMLLKGERKERKEGGEWSVTRKHGCSYAQPPTAYRNMIQMMMLLLLVLMEIVLLTTMIKATTVYPT